MSPRAALAAAALALLGCRTQPFGAPLGSDAGAGEDGGAGSDGGNACTTHTRRTVVLAGLDPIPGVALQTTQTVRVLASLKLRPCDVLGDITLDLQPGNATDFVTLTAHAWVSSAADCGAPVKLIRPLVVKVDAFNPRVLVRDGAPGGSAALSIDLTAFGGGSCNPVPVASPCQLICDCGSDDPQASCLIFTGGENRCARSCAEDVECLPGQECAQTITNGPLFACRAPEAPCCAQPCGFGQTCDAASCACKVTAPVATGGCRCDADCGGGLCVDAHGCINPCVIDADCPRGVPSCSNGACGPPTK